MNTSAAGLMPEILALPRRVSRRFLRRRYPDQPWRWRTDWASGLLCTNNRQRMIVAVTLAVLWNVLAAVACLLAPWSRLGSEPWWVLVALLPAVGVVFIALALLTVMRWRRQGDSRLRLDTVPGIVGGRIAGTAYLPGFVERKAGVTVGLRCVLRRNVQREGVRKLRETPLWSTGAFIGEEKLHTAGSTMLAAPVNFIIPHNTPATENDPANRVYWELKVCGERTGRAYCTRFHVPVFNTPDNPYNT